MPDVLRELVVALGFDVDEASGKAVLDTIGTIKKAAVGLGVAFGLHEAWAAIAGATEGMAQLGNETRKTGLRLGITTQALQELEFAGAPMDELATSMRVLSKNAYEASTGSKEMRERFKALGVTVTDGNGKLKSSETLLTELGDGFANMKDETKRTALAQEIFGRSGTNMIPFLLKGSDAIREQREEAQKLGVVMSDDFLKQSRQFAEAEHRDEEAAKALKIAIATELLPVFVEMKKAAFQLKVALIPVAHVVGKVLAGAIITARAALKGFMQAAQFVWQTFGPWKIAMALLAAGIATVISMFVSMGPIAAATALQVAASWVIANAGFVLTALLIGIIVAAIFLLIEDFVKMGDGAESVTGTMIQGFKDLIDETGSVPDAIAAMLETTKKFWGDYFKDVIENGKGFWAEFFRWFAGAASAVTQFWIDTFKGQMLKAFTGLGKSTLDALSGGHAQDIHDFFHPFQQRSSVEEIMPPSAGSSFNHGGNDVTINVSGVSAPGEVAKATSDGVRGVLEDDARAAMQSFVVAGALP